MLALPAPPPLPPPRDDDEDAGGDMPDGSDGGSNHSDDGDDGGDPDVEKLMWLIDDWKSPSDPAVPRLSPGASPDAPPTVPEDPSAIPSDPGGAGLGADLVADHMRALPRRWGAFSFTVKHPGTQTGEYGGLQAECPFHKKNTTSMCRKFFRITGPSAEEFAKQVRCMKYWCTQAPCFDRQWIHVFLTDYENPPSDEALEGMLIQDRPDPSDILDDETYYATVGRDDPEAAEHGRGRGTRGRGLAAARGRARGRGGRDRGRGRSGTVASSAAAAPLEEATGAGDEDRLCLLHWRK
jgi:hypothetical protein